MTGLVPSVHMEAPRNVQKESFRNKSFKKEFQGEKECQGLREDEICRKRASGIRTSQKSFKGEWSVRVCATTKLTEKSFRNKSFKKEFQGEIERQGLREDEIRTKTASGIRASKKLEGEKEQ